MHLERRVLVGLPQRSRRAVALNEKLGRAARPLVHVRRPRVEHLVKGWERRQSRRDRLCEVVEFHAIIPASDSTALRTYRRYSGDFSLMSLGMAWTMSLSHARNAS